jgi:DNA polymerase-3 subunit delta
MIIFLYGTDTFRSKRKLDEIASSFREREDASGLNTVTLDAAKAEPAEIHQALFAPAFLGNKRLAVIKGMLALKREEQKPFLELVAKLPASTTAVFYEAADAKACDKSPLYPLLVEGKYHWEFAPLSGRELESWLAAEANAHAVTFEPHALSAFIEAVRSDSARAANEIAKLAAYVGGRQIIEVQDVALMVTGEVQEDMFGFLDAVANRDSKRAAVMLEQQIMAGTEPMQLLAMLARTVRILIQARDLLDRRYPQPEAIRELGIHPFAARKALAQAQSFETQTLRQLHAALLDTDRRIKTGSASSPRVVLDLMVAKAVLAGK